MSWVEGQQADAAPVGRVLVLIPAFNEQAALPGVLAELRELRADPVVVVSDGSTDATASIARRAGATVLELPFNVGVGGALRLGFRYAVCAGFTTIVQLDADGQHDPASIEALLRALVADGADMVVGTRFHAGSTYRVSGARRWTMRLLGVLLSRIAGTHLTDTTSGFRAFGPRALELFAQDYPSDYLGDTIEAIVIAARAGLQVAETPVRMRPRAGGEASTSAVKAAVLLGRALLAVVLALTRPRRGG